MASPKPQASAFAASSSCEAPARQSPDNSASSNVVQVLDSNEPLALRSPQASASSSSAEQFALSSTSQNSGSIATRKHPYVIEILHMWNVERLVKKLGTEQQCILFAEQRELIRTEKLCTYHKIPMKLEIKANSGLGFFRCRKSACKIKGSSRAKGTWFEQAKLSLVTIFKIMYMFSHNSSYEHTQRECKSDDNDSILSHATISDWFTYCRECIIIYELEHQNYTTKIGGHNKIVQIDESKFGKRKYNRGRHIEGHWVIGMIENDSVDLRLEVCPDNERSADVLVPLIKKHVLEGSIIHTDFWKAYDCLSEHGFVHFKVNHSDRLNRFVAPDGTHTQRIESQWRVIKRAFHQDQSKIDFADWLIIFNWRRRIQLNHEDPFEVLLTAVKYVYPR